jgi:hypothetical protein
MSRLPDHQPQIDILARMVFPAPEPKRPQAAFAPELGMDAKEIMRLASRASNGPEIEALYQGDLCGRPGESEARGALILMLIFYTRDPGLLEQLLRTSDRDPSKFDTPRGSETFLQYEIRRALERYTGATYTPGRGQTPPAGGVAPVDPSGEIAALQARIACLEDIVDTQRAALVDRDERIQAYESDIGGYTDVLIEVAKLVDERIARGMVESDGSVHVPYGLVAARRTGKDASPEARNAVKSRVSKAVSKAVKRGLLSKHTVTQISSVDEDTGEILDVPRRTRMTYIQWGPDYRTMRVSLARCKRPQDAPRRGGDQVRCEDHPEAKVITTRIDRCSVCRKILRAPGRSGETLHAPPEPRIESDKANLLYIPIPQGVAEVDKASLLLQDSGEPPPAEPGYWEALTGVPSVETTPIMEVVPDPWGLLYDRAQAATPVICSSTIGPCSQPAFCARQGKCRWARTDAHEATNGKYPQPPEEASS